MMVTLASRLFGLLGLMLLIGCATRPVNPPIARVDPEAGYRFLTRQHCDHDRKRQAVRRAVKKLAERMPRARGPR